MGSPFAPPFTLRAATPADLDGVFQVVTSSDMREFGEADTSYDEFASDWVEFDHPNDLCVAVDGDERIVGYAKCTADGVFSGIDAEGYVRSDCEGHGIGTALIQWTERRAAEFVNRAPVGTRVAIQNPANAFNAEANELFTGLGYTLARQFWRMQSTFTGQPNVGDAPNGITIRPAATLDDERLIWSVCQSAFADHWGSRPQPFEEWRSSRTKNAHDPSLWWIAVDGDRPVGALVGYIIPGTGGWIKDVGVLAEYRRRGIATALVERALNAFYERGQASAALGVDTANATGATRVYEQAGMRITRGFAIWEKTLRDGVVLSAQDGDE